MPSFTKLFVLAACVVVGLAVPETRCDEAQLVKSQTIKTSGGSVSVNSFSCAPRVSKRQSSSSEIVNLSGQICEISCDNDAGALPPAIDDCNHIREAIRILGGVNAIDSQTTFNVGGFSQQKLVFGTCAFYFNNNIPDEIEFDWSDFGNDASQAAFACFLFDLPLSSEGRCTAINGKWSVAVAHS